MMRLGCLGVLCACLGASALPAASADDLFKRNRWANIASDQKAAEIGDVLTVVVYQNAESRNAADNDARRRRSLDGAIKGGGTDESGQLSLNFDYGGHGETRRSESFVTQISVSVQLVLANGDLLIGGDQLMNVNGEKTTIQIRGRVRPADISGDNQVLSTRIADAQINYHGEGFVSRNARSGVVGWVFGVLGLGG